MGLPLQVRAFVLRARGRLLACTGLALTLAACSATGGSADPDRTAAGTGGGGGAGATGGADAASDASGGGAGEDAGTGGGLTFDGGLPEGGGPVGDCPPETELIYLLGYVGKEFYSFHPPTMTFKKIATLDCPGTSSFLPWSMSVDRSGTAWVLYSHGAIFHVDTKDGACVATPFAPNQHGFELFGMGFVADAPGATTEKLYVSDYWKTLGLGVIDPGSLELTPVGLYDALSDYRAELTGTGEARLYGFFTGQVPPQVAEIDRATASILSTAPQPGVPADVGWAFAFWGGDFYLFYYQTQISTVARYRPSDGTTTVLKDDIPFQTIGAGVSTCAPIKPPN